MRRWPLATCLAAACSGTSEPKLADGKAAVPPRSISVSEDSVVLEGTWRPMEAETTQAPNTVRVVCRLAERSCREDVSWLPERPGELPVRESQDYRIQEGPKGPERAHRLTAARKDALGRVEIRISLNGLAATKAVVGKGAEVRWRLE